MEKLKKHPILCCWGVFLVCALARIVEYFLIRTDESFLAENFIHKAFGIVLLFAILRTAKATWSDIGFKRGRFALQAGKGLLLGASCFVVAYAVECLILSQTEGGVSLRFYASGFSLDGQVVEQTGALFVLLCVGFNLVNVWMEEGVFRGLFAKVLEDRPFIRSILFIAFLFGIWHWVMPFRDFLEGDSSVANLLVMGVGYIILAGVMSVKWSLLYKMTGSLWMGLGDHLFNNVVVTNLVHVVSVGGADELQIVRILIGQLLSFALVLWAYRRRQKPKA